MLCDRADRTPGRGFDGRLAQLAIYDAALTESNVRRMLTSCMTTRAHTYCLRTDSLLWSMSEEV